MLKIAFSWDDGSLEDLKLLDFSVKNGIPGIFFIPGSNRERNVLNRQDIKTILANGFEIGSHTLSHTYLTEIPLIKAEEEMLQGKDYLEQILGQKIPHFCYPGGKYNKQLTSIGEKYFASARTADTGAVVMNNTFLIKPAFHFFNRGKKSLFYNSLKQRSPIFRLLLSRLSVNDYFKLVTSLTDALAESDKIYRIIIWGHSWEIENYKLWDKLKELFRHLNINHAESISGYSELLGC